MNYWLVKTEPDNFSWDLFVKNERAVWDGVRNYQARNNLKAMKKGDLVLFYHSKKGLEIVGLAQVDAEYYQDPSTSDAHWVAVDLIPVKPFQKSVSLNQIKLDVDLQNMLLLKNSRLSVMPVENFEFEKIMKLSNEI